MESQNTPTNTSNTPCQELLTLLPAYSLGTATPDEERRVEVLLPLCPEAAAVLDDYQSLGDSMIGLYPSTEEPPSSAALLQRVRASTPQHRAVPVVDTPVKPRIAPRLVDSREALPLPSTNHRAVLPPTQPRRLWPWLALAACVVVAFAATNLYWASQIDGLRRDQQAFLQTLATSQTNTQPILNADNHHRELLPADTTINSEASFVWNSDDQIGALLVDGLPSLDPGETYQLWLVRGEKSLSLGTFEVDENGVGFLVFRSSQPVETFSHIGVNIEPDGGTSEPTTPHLIVGNI